MTANELKTLQGVDTVAFCRMLKNSAAEAAHLMPWQTGLSFDPSRDSNSTTTKDGPVQTSSAVETDMEVDFINNTSAIADAMYDSLIDGDTVEVWIVNRKRRNEAGQYFAWYAQAVVSEDSNDNDPDDFSTREVSFAVNGTPKRGWVTLTDDQQETLDYVFRGVDTTTEADPTGKGSAWTDGDAGTNVPDTTTAPETPADTGGDTPAQG